MTSLVFAQFIWIVLAWRVMRLWMTEADRNDDLLIKLRRANEDNVALADRVAELEEQLDQTFIPYDPEQETITDEDPS